MESVNIGVSERDSGEVGFSLQLGGFGCSRSDFSWQASQAATKGALNSGQFGACVPGEPSPIPSMLPSAAPSVFPSENPSGSPRRPRPEYPPLSSLNSLVSSVSCCTGYCVLCQTVVSLTDTMVVATVASPVVPICRPTFTYELCYPQVVRLRFHLRPRPRHLLFAHAVVVLLAPTKSCNG